MCEEDTIQMLNAKTERLRSKIGTHIDEETLILNTDQPCGAHPVVECRCREANLAATTDHGYPHRRSRSQKKKVPMKGYSHHFLNSSN
jgi:hypothetical protein